MNRYQVYYDAGDKKFTEKGYIYIGQARKAIKKYFIAQAKTVIKFKDKIIESYNC